jgi:hypothetical protein
LAITLAISIPSLRGLPGLFRHVRGLHDWIRDRKGNAHDKRKHHIDADEPAPHLF